MLSAQPPSGMSPIRSDDWSAVWLDKHAEPGVPPPANVARRWTTWVACDTQGGTAGDLMRSMLQVESGLECKFALSSDLWEMKDSVEYIVTTFAETEGRNECKQILEVKMNKRQLLYKNHIS